MSDCPHGMPTPASCLDCMDEGNLPPSPPDPPEAADSRPFLAQYPTDCPECGFPMQERRVVHTTRGRYVHVDCIGGEA